jgi:hypothetical protein
MINGRSEIEKFREEDQMTKVGIYQRVSTHGRGYSVEDQSRKSLEYLDRIYSPKADGTEHPDEVTDGCSAKCDEGGSDD